jgi:hypothetical protein
MQFGVVVREVVEAYHAYNATALRRTAPAPTVGKHICSSRCPFFVRNRVYICTLSGNLHVCTREHCDQITETREFGMCAWTELQYPLCAAMHPGEEYSSGSGSGTSDALDFRARVIALPGATPTVPARQSPAETRAHTRLSRIPTARVAARARGKSERVADGLRLQVERVIERLLQPRDVVKPESRKRRLVDSSETARRVRARVDTPSPPPSPATVEADVRQRLVALCIRLWRLLAPALRALQKPPPTRTSYKPSKAYRYTFDYHCIVVLYHTRLPNGFRCAAFEIPHEPTMAVRLPLITDLRHMPYNIDYTPASNTFLSAAATLCNRLRRGAD